VLHLKELTTTLKKFLHRKGGAVTQLSFLDARKRSTAVVGVRYLFLENDSDYGNNPLP
jgi:hypothetical protein